MTRKKQYSLFKPVISGAKEREESIKENKPAIFKIEEFEFPIDVGKKSNMEFLKQGFFQEIDDYYNFNNLGKKAVRDHDKSILRHSQKQGIDPDIVRSVMYAENARGHKLGLNRAFENIGWADSILPMNIQKDRWGGLAGKKSEDMYDNDANIETSAVLLRRIRDRIEKPTPEKIGTLWNSIDRAKTNDFGKYIGEIYKEKPWRKFD